VVLKRHIPKVGGFDKYREETATKDLLAVDWWFAKKKIKVLLRVMRLHSSSFVVPIHGVSFVFSISPIGAASVDDRLNLYTVGNNPPRNGHTAVALQIIFIISSQKKGDVLPKDQIISPGLSSVALPSFRASQLF